MIYNDDISNKNFDDDDGGVKSANVGDMMILTT